MNIYCDTTRFIWEVLENGEYKFLFDQLTVIDAGCDIGTFSLWIYPHAKFIHAIETEPRHLDNFRKTINDNGLKNIQLYEERLLSLGDFMSGHQIPIADVLKLDVEGDEVEILSHNFPKDRVRVIIGEYHQKPVRDIIESLGYRYFEFPNQHFLARI